MTETFYGDFYGFTSAPFHITPDPALLFPSETHRAALGAIEYGIAAGKGFIVITGEVGVGKTTVLRGCLDQLDPGKVKVIYLFNPALTTAELYAELLDEFDVILPPTSSTSDTLRTLQRTLFAVCEEGTQVVLAIDEAQRMPEETLESLRILSNLETHRSKLLQIILVGQPELEAILSKHSLRQLAQRVAVRARIAPLTFRESCRYISHRAKVAGREPGRPLFTLPALLYLARFGRGIPRTINVCCDNALINGYGHGATRIGLRIARESCRTVRFRSPLSRFLTTAALVMALIGVGVSAEVLIHRLLTTPATESVVPPAKHPETPPATAEPPQTAAEGPEAEISPSPSEDAAMASAVPQDSSSAAATDSQAPPEPAGAPPASAASGAEGSANQGAAPSTTPTPAPTTVPESESPSRGSEVKARWVVHAGDTLYRACVATYGKCDEKTLRAILAQNPRIGTDRKIRVGEVIELPRLDDPSSP
jgi:general secretion pathway protein A